MDISVGTLKKLNTVFPSAIYLLRLMSSLRMLFRFGRESSAHAVSLLFLINFAVAFSLTTGLQTVVAMSVFRDARENGTPDEFIVKAICYFCLLVIINIITSLYTQNEVDEFAISEEVRRNLYASNNYNINPEVVILGEMAFFETSGTHEKPPVETVDSVLEKYGKNLSVHISIHGHLNISTGDNKRLSVMIVGDKI